MMITGVWSDGSHGLIEHFKESHSSVVRFEILLLFNVHFHSFSSE